MTEDKSEILIFPFDLFGSAGTARGAELLADALREMLDDNRREEIPTRAQAYQDKVSIRELSLEKLADYQDWRKRARQQVRRVWSRDHFLFWITGNHLGTLPVYDELSERHPDTLVIQFDAHLDIYHLSDCTTELSHGNFLLHCAGPLPPVVNVGHRELLLTAEHAGKYYRQQFPAAQLITQPDQVVRELRKLSQKASRIFLDLDCDVLDLAFFPALSHPQPFGLSSQMLLLLLEAVWSPKVVGVAISEFDPAHDQHDRSLGLLMWLIEYLLLRRYEPAK